MSGPPPDPLQVGRHVLGAEAIAILRCRDNLDVAFGRAVEAVLACEGRLITSGVGKSGHVAAKLAATFASTGTPAHFVHISEAVHGDLGMITPADLLLILSHSGETPEVVSALPHIDRRGAAIMALTDGADSTLARAADIVLSPGCDQEADPLGLAPTASTTVALAVGDALAMAVAAMRGFSAEDFHALHPGGDLGRLLADRLATEA